MINYVFNMMICVSKTMNLVLKTMNLVLKMVKNAGKETGRPDRAVGHRRVQGADGVRHTTNIYRSLICRGVSDAAAFVFVFRAESEAAGEGHGEL